MEIGFSQARQVGRSGTKKGCYDDNCVFNGASYTSASHIYVTPENELRWFYQDRHKSVFLELFFVY